MALLKSLFLFPLITVVNYGFKRLASTREHNSENISNFRFTPQSTIKLHDGYFYHYDIVFIFKRNTTSVDLIRNFEFESEDVRVPDEALPIRIMAREEVVEKLGELLASLQSNRLTRIERPLRTWDNMVFNERGQLFLGEKVAPLGEQEDPQYLAKLIYVTKHIITLLENNQHAMDYEIRAVPRASKGGNEQFLWSKNEISYEILQDLAIAIGTRLACMNIYSGGKGECAGLLKEEIGEESFAFHLDYTINRKKNWRNWWAADLGKFITSGARMILLLSDMRIFLDLFRSKFWEQVPCILISCLNPPDLPTREYVKILAAELHIPVVGISNGSPLELGKLLTYALGSVGTAQDTPWATVNNFYWLGIFPEDFGAEDSQYVRGASSDEIAQATEMATWPNLQANTQIIDQLHAFLERQDVAALHSMHDAGRLEKFLISKLESGDVIKI